MDFSTRLSVLIYLLKIFKEEHPDINFDISIDTADSIFAILFKGNGICGLSHDNEWVININPFDEWTILNLTDHESVVSAIKEIKLEENGDDNFI